MPRIRLDLRQLPHRLGYLIAIAVVAVTLLIAQQVSKGHAAPLWWDDFVVPTIYWSSPLLVAIAIAYRVYRTRRRRQLIQRPKN